MAGGNELAQHVKLIENVQTTLDESEKMALITSALQILIRDTTTNSLKLAMAIRIEIRKIMTPRVKTYIL